MSDVPAQDGAAVPIVAPLTAPVVAKDDKSLKSDYYFFKSTPKDQLESYLPKPLSGPVEETTAVPKGASTWNKAGTWEESDATAWAMERLKELFIGIAPTNGAAVKVTEASSVSGEASRIMSRGKRKADFEVTGKFVWAGTDAAGAAVSGTISFSDVDSASTDDFDVTVAADAADAGHVEARNAMKTCVKEFRKRMGQFSKELVEGPQE